MYKLISTNFETNTVTLQTKPNCHSHIDWTCQRNVTKDAPRTFCNTYFEQLFLLGVYVVLEGERREKKGSEGGMLEHRLVWLTDQINFEWCLNRDRNSNLDNFGSSNARVSERDLNTARRVIFMDRVEEAGWQEQVTSQGEDINSWVCLFTSENWFGHHL